MAPMRVIDLPAAPRARGEAHGEELRDLVHESLHRWRDSLAADGHEPDAWIAAFLGDTDFEPAIRRWSPDLLEEVEGLASGAGRGVSRDEMLAFQLVDEQWCYEARRRAEHEHCSTLGVAPVDGAGPNVVAQNLDLPLWFDGLQVVLRLAANGEEPGSVVVTSAGFIAMNGLNERGVGVVVNALPDVPSARHGLPVAFAIRQSLTSTTATEAAAFLRSVPHASGQNYVIGDSTTVIGVECDAEGTTVVGEGSTGTVVGHTNHAIARTCERTRRDLAAGALANSEARLAFLDEHEDDLCERGRAAIVDVLSDGSVPIRRVPTAERPAATFATVVFELTVPPTALVRGGPADTTFARVEPATTPAVAVP